MKTKLITALFFLLTFQLNAQFHFKVSMDEDGLYTVKLKSDIAVSPGSVVGSGQISLTAPFGGFKIGDITSVNGTWNDFYDSIGQESGLSLTKEYYFIGLYDGIGIADKGIAIGEEITLITFRNVGKCTGAIELITSTDQLFLYATSSCQNCETRSSPDNYLSTFDILTGEVYNVTGTYDTRQAICNPNNNLPILEEIIELEVDKKGLHYFNFKWTPIANATFYEVKIRQKGKLNWEKKLIATTPNAYLYAPIEKEYEYQVIAHHNPEFSSKIENTLKH